MIAPPPALVRGSLAGALRLDRRGPSKSPSCWAVPEIRTRLARCRGTRHLREQSTPILLGLPISCSALSLMPWSRTMLGLVITRATYSDP